MTEKYAQEQLATIAKRYPGYIERPPNRKWRRLIINLIKHAGKDYRDSLSTQKSFWERNKPKPVIA